MYKSDGEALAAAEDKIITLSKEQHKVIDYEMSEFSSWGATSALTLKPEITAPGGNIYSSLSIDENGGNVYGYNSGTSMASPNAAGGLTLIRHRINELYPDLSAKERLALTYKTAMSTAEIRKDPDGRVYSPRKQGAGLLDVAGSIQTKAYISVKGTDRAKIELGDYSERIGIYTLDFDVVNLSEEELRYTVDVIALTEALEEKDGKSFFALASETLGREFSISVEGGGRKEGEFGIIVEGGKSRAEYLSEPFGRDVFLAYGGKITEIFASMNPSVASVDENGLITAKKEGSTEIFVTLRAENSCGEITTHIAKCSVKVAGRIADGMTSFSDDGNDFVIEDGVLVKYNGKESRVVIPEGVRVIGISAFYGNKTIKTIEIREGLEGIASRAFMNSSITEITLPASIKTVGESAFESCLCKKAVFILGEAEAVIGKSAFRNSALESLVLSDNVAEIGEKAFAGCKLRTVNLPESLRILGNEAFCDAITDVKDFVLPENIEYLGDKSLAQTKIIAEELIIPEDCTYVGANVFYEGSKVSAVRLPASVEKIDFGKHQFINNYSGIYHISGTHPFLKVDCGAIIDYVHNVYLRCVSLPDDGKITIPDGIIRIGERAFAYVPVKSVAVPESVATIGDEAFRVEGVKIFFGGKLPLLETYDTKGRYFNFKNAEIYVAEGISVPMSYISQSENSMTELTSEVKELLKKEERTIEIKKLNEKIANIVVTSLENKTEIQDIRDKYDALSEDEKLLVDNYYKLILAEKDLILLEKDAENVDYKGQISNLEELCDELESAIEKLNGEIGEAKKLSDEDEKIISELKEALASTRDEIAKISVEKSQMRTSFIVALIIAIVISALSIVVIMKKKKK